MTLTTKSSHASPETSPQPKTQAKTPSSKQLRNTRPAQDDVPVSAPSRARPERMSVAESRAIECARIGDRNRARDVVVLDMRSATSVVDFFTIVTVTSRRQANALANDIAVEMKKHGESRLGIEGAEEGRWVLLDYGDFIVHVFSEDARAYYELDELWGDAPRAEWREPAPAVP